MKAKKKLPKAGAARTRTEAAGVTPKPASEQTVGARVHFLRQQQNMTLEQLSTLSGLTKSFVSKVERSISVPSISTAKSLAESFGLTVSQLLGEENSDNSVCLVRKGERRSFMKTGTAGGYNYEMIAGAKQYKRMEPYIMRPPTRFQDGRKFGHLGEEFMFVIAGSIEVELAGKRYELSRGDSLYFDSHFSHRTRSLGGRNAEVLVVITAIS
jgi:mannose-6-phosphate isomerase-like protein (cupin superfamily)/DNA-binding XRE family transcriptional regulator